MCARFWLPFLGHCATRGTTRRVVWCSIGRPRGLKLSIERRDRQAWWSNVLMIILRFFLHGVEGAMDRGDRLPVIPPVLRIHGQKVVAQWFPGLAAAQLLLQTGRQRKTSGTMVSRELTLWSAFVCRLHSACPGLIHTIMHMVLGTSNVSGACACSLVL